nr:hypothetical protein CFP56_63272 [Quercus suber]
MMKGLMDYCASHETVLGCLREKVEARETKLRELTAWKELGGSFVDGFDDCFRQVKASFPNLDLSHISIDHQAQTPALPIYFKGTDELFADETNPDPQGVGDATQVDLEKSIKDITRQLKGDQTVEEKNEETPTV